MVKDIAPNNFYLDTPRELTSFHGSLLFAANDFVHGDELWKSDGTAAGTVLLKDINLKDNSYYGSNPFGLTVVGDQVLFQASDGTNRSELWKTDGTTAGTTLVKVIDPKNNFIISRMINVNGIAGSTMLLPTLSISLEIASDLMAATGSNGPGAAPFCCALSLRASSRIVAR